MRTMTMSRRRRRCCCWRWYSIKRGRRIECSACDVCECVCVLFTVKVQWTKLQVERIYHGQSQKSISNVSKVFHSHSPSFSRCAILLLYFWGENASDSILCVILVSTIHTFVSLPPFFSFSSVRSFSISHNLYLYLALFHSNSHTHSTHALSINLLHCVVATSKRQSEYSIHAYIISDVC